jgi:outer membrane protein assembly factor BamB
MRLQAAFLLASCAPAFAIFADEVSQIDYHHALLGAPQARTTFFHRPLASSSASLLYTLSEKSILGAVNPKDGSIVWRQNLSEYNNNAGLGSGFLRAADGEDIVFSALSDEVSSWGASDGKLGWTKRFDDDLVVDLELVDDVAAQRDPIVLFQGKSGIIRRLDSATGLVKWEYKDNR